MHRGARHRAQQRGEDTYFTGVPCKRGHIAERYTRNGTCKECATELGRKAYAENPARFADASRKWRAKNPTYGDENRDRINQNSETYRKRNLPKVAALRAKRRARSNAAEPAWLTRSQRQQMRNMYQRAAQKTATTREIFEVDHIVPLAGDRVCGLHVPWNLQVISRSENRRKSNFFNSDAQGAA